MNTDESKPLSEKPAAPAKGVGLKRPAPPAPTKSSQAQKPADEEGATSADAAAQAMPDLDQFNFMKW